MKFGQILGNNVEIFAQKGGKVALESTYGESKIYLFFFEKLILTLFIHSVFKIRTFSELWAISWKFNKFSKISGYLIFFFLITFFLAKYIEYICNLKKKNCNFRSTVKMMSRFLDWKGATFFNFYFIFS